jgi:hypothetical protein
LRRSRPHSASRSCLAAGGGGPVSCGACARLLRPQGGGATELLGAPWFVSVKSSTATSVGASRFSDGQSQTRPSCGLKHGIYAVRATCGQTS